MTNILDSILFLRRRLRQSNPSWTDKRVAIEADMRHAVMVERRAQIVAGHRG